MSWEERLDLLAWSLCAALGGSLCLLPTNESVGRDFPGGPVVKTLHSQMQGAVMGCCMSS